MRRALALLCALGSVSLLGCESEEPEVDDPIDEAGLAAGKADGPLSDCEIDAIVALANDPATDFRALGVTSTATKRILLHRDGRDGRAGTGDDDRFDDVSELDAVPYVGAATFRKFAAAIVGRCGAAAAADVSVVFSPQLAEASHLVKIAELVDRAQRSIDIAMYSYSSSAISQALSRARQRGVVVRFIFETANEDKSSPVGSPSAALEALGIDVRYVNTIMHHKVALIDARPDPAAATLITGSANWSSSAATRFDENTVFIRNNAEAVVRFQREFDTLWKGSRDFTLGTAAPAVESPVVADAA